MKRAKRLIVAVAVLAMLAGCYPGGPEFVNELDLVYTNYDDSYDFTSRATYALPEGVIEIDDDNFPGAGSDQPEFIDPEYSERILNRVRQNMNTYGYTEVDEDEDPDFVFLASAMSTTNLYYFYDPSWWWWYYPGWGPGWGWGYPGYTPGYVTGYTSGTILLQISDPNGISGNEVPIVWTGTMNGLLQGSDASILSRIDVAIDQAFSQSTYLDK